MSKNQYELDLFDNNLLQFSLALAALSGVLDDGTITKASSVMGISPEMFKTLLARAEKKSQYFDECKDEDPMITRRSRARVHGDKDYTLSYDRGIEVVATGGQPLFDIDLNDDGSLDISVIGGCKHKDKVLDDTIVIEPRGKGRIKLVRSVY